MTRLFVSYAREDRAMAEVLAEELQRVGHEVWWDRELVPADDFRREIDYQLKRASALLVVWTPASVSSKWVLAEADDAFNDGKPIFGVHQTDLDCRLIPKPFNQFNSSSFQERKNIIRALNRPNDIHLVEDVDNNRNEKSFTLYYATKSTLTGFALAQTLVFGGAFAILLLILWNFMSAGKPIASDLAVAIGGSVLAYTCMLLATRNAIAGVVGVVCKPKAIARTDLRELAWFGTPNDHIFNSHVAISSSWRDVSLEKNLFGFVCKARGRVLFRRYRFLPGNVPDALLTGIESRATGTKKKAACLSLSLPNFSVGSETKTWILAYATIAAVALAPDIIGDMIMRTGGVSISGNDWAAVWALHAASPFVEGAVTARVLKRKLIEFPTAYWCVLYGILGAVAGSLAGSDDVSLSTLIKELADEIGRNFGGQKDFVLIFNLFGITCLVSIVGNVFGLLQALILRPVAQGLAKWVYWSGPALAVPTTALGIVAYFSPVGSDLSGMIEEGVRSSILTLVHGALLLPAYYSLRRQATGRI